MLDEHVTSVSQPNDLTVPKKCETFENDKCKFQEKNEISETVVESFTKKEFPVKKGFRRLTKFQQKKIEIDSILKRDQLKDDELDLENLKDSKNEEVKVYKWKRKGKEFDEKISPENKMKLMKPKVVPPYYKTENDVQMRPMISERFVRSKRNQLKEKKSDEEIGWNISRRNNLKFTNDFENGKEGRMRMQNDKRRLVQKIDSDNSFQEIRPGEGKKSGKVKIIAFGSTFQKNENEMIPLAKKITPSFTERMMRTRNMRTKEPEFVYDQKSSSNVCLKQSIAKLNNSRNKLIYLGDESNKDRKKEKVSNWNFTGKKVKSLYQTSSEMKPNLYKDRVDGDMNEVNNNSEEKPETGINLGFFERLHQNLKGYFSTKSPETGRCQVESNHIQEEDKKRRTASFHRSKIFQKNALVKPSPKSRKTTILIKGPGEQIKNISSADGMASAYAQVQEFPQEINWRNLSKATSVQEEFLTSIVNYLLGDSLLYTRRKESSRTGVYRSSNRPVGKRPSNVILSSKNSFQVNESHRNIKMSRSEGNFTKINSPIHYEINRISHGDVLQREKITKFITEKLKPEKIDFVPKRTKCIIYSLTEIKYSDNESIQTPQQETRTTESELSVYTADDGESDEKDSPTAEIISPTLKDIINLARKVFRENPETEIIEMDKENENIKEKSLGYHLNELMQEKKNYLNLQKTKNFKKPQKVNFITDSFNFFNLLNKEFLKVRTSNASIEKLRNIITEKKDFKMKDYLDIYKKVIKTSLTDLDECFIDGAKMNLEKYTDLYYDMMKSICIELERKIEGKKKTVCTDSFKSTISGNPGKINYYEIFQKGNKKNGELKIGYFDKNKPKIEKFFYPSKIENEKNRDSSRGRSNERTNNLKKRNINLYPKIQKSKEPRRVNNVVELLSPQKKKEIIVKKDITEKNNYGKILLQISVCNDNLVIKQVESSATRDTESVGTNSFVESSEDDKEKNIKKLIDKNHFHLKNSMIEKNLDGSNGTSSEEIEKTHSELLLKTESNVTIPQNSSVDVNNENMTEHPILKFKAFRKILNEGFKYLTSFGESSDIDCLECPKISKGKKIPETCEKPINYPKTKILLKESFNKNQKNYHEDCKRVYQKNTFMKDPPRQTMLKGMSPIRSKINEKQDEKIKRILKVGKNNKKEFIGEKKKESTNIWWRNDKNIINNNSPIKYQKYDKNQDNTITNGSLRMNKQKENPLSREKRKCEEKKYLEKNVKDEEISIKEIQSNYATPIGSQFDWKFGMKKSSTLIKLTKELTNEEEEEQELDKMDLSCEDDKKRDHESEIPLNQINLRMLSINCNNSQRIDWIHSLETSHQDYHRMSEVLSHFMGNISEAWKAVIYLKDLITPKSMEELQKEEEVFTTEEENIQQEEDSGKKDINNIIEQFRNFLRIVNNIFEYNQEKESVKKELFLIMKEFIKSSSETSSVKTMLKKIPITENRTIYYRELAEIPQELKDMIAEILVSQIDDLNMTNEDYEPGSFVSAVKIVGEKIKNLYMAQYDQKVKMISNNEEKMEEPKIYYLPQNNSSEKDQKSEEIRSNLGSIAEKINKIYKEKASHIENKEEKSEEISILKKTVQSQSSIYFDAMDNFQPSDDGQNFGVNEKSNVNSEEITLNPTDDSYFLLNEKNFGKHRNFLYNKAITLIKSDNPNKFKYGMTLLQKVMEKDNESPLIEKQIEQKEHEKKLYDLEKIMNMCQITETELKEKEKKILTDRKPNERDIELMKTNEYLKNHIHLLKVAMEDIKISNQKRNSTGKILALENSRRTNIERQLMDGEDFSENSFVNQKYLDNAIAFINSIGTIGCSIEKFSKNFLPNWLNRKKEEEKLSTILETGNENIKESYYSILDSNKAFVLNLKNNIDKKQKKIRELLDQAAKEGITREESLTNEKISKNLKDLKKCYYVLEKMISDPTMIPPKWFKMSKKSENENEIFEKNTAETNFQVMSILQDIISGLQSSRERNLTRLNQSFHSEIPPSINYQLD